MAGQQHSSQNHDHNYWRRVYERYISLAPNLGTSPSHFVAHHLMNMKLEVHLQCPILIYFQ